VSGNFDFQSVPAGEYQFRVVDRTDAVIHQSTTRTFEPRRKDAVDAP
jgi:hypothetical protein